MSDIKIRVRSAVKIGGFILLFYIFSYVPDIFAYFSSIVGAFAVYEALKVADLLDEKRGVILMLFAAVFPFVRIEYFVETETAVYISAIMVFVFILVRLERGKRLSRYAAYFIALVIPLLLKAIPELFAMENGLIYLRFGMLACIFTDLFAMLFGRLFGRKSLAPRVSPNKTVEGSVLGTVCCVIALGAVEYIFSVLLDFNIDYIRLIPLALAASVFGQFGDLCASAIKRICGCKDYSDIIPGHGGILDRFDSTIFAIPVVYMLVSWGCGFVK